MTESLLEIKDLQVSYGKKRVLCNVNLRVERGQGVGIVGESGSGKSTLAKAILRLLPETAAVTGEVRFAGQEMRSLSDADLDRLRWEKMAVVFQNALASLDPAYRIGEQIIEAIRAHRKVRPSAARATATDLLARTGVDPKYAAAFPHQISGGMRQRAAIAMAMALEPDLLIADEPTTALDVLTQARVLGELVDIHRRHNNTLILITHDIGIVAQTCQSIVVLYAGSVVEQGPVRRVLKTPSHPYTMGLMRAAPRLVESSALVSMAGGLPDMTVPTPGCIFAPRCPFAQAVCREVTPPSSVLEDGQVSACHFGASAAALRELATKAETWEKVG